MEDNTYYVYRHIRLDTNQVFYIGLGRNRRAWHKGGRNKHWNNIIKKTKYEVEIILSELSRENAIKKEIEFIKIYGRSDLGYGTLCNKSDGGDGVVNKSIKVYNKGNDKWGHLKDDIIKDIMLGLSDNQIVAKYNTNKGVPYRYRKKYITDKSLIKQKSRKTGKYDHLIDPIINDFKNGLRYSDIMSKYNVAEFVVYRIKKKYLK